MSLAVDSVALLFPGALGDFLCWLPSLLSLRDHCAGRLLVVARPDFLELLHLPNLRTASIDGRAVADLFTAGRELSASTRALFAGCRRVYSWTGFGDPDFERRLRVASGGSVDVFPFRGMRPGEHAVEYYGRCLGVTPRRDLFQALRQDRSWLPEFLWRHDAGGRPIVVVHPGSGAAKKNWHGFADFVRAWCARHDDAIVWLTGPAEADATVPAGAVPSGERSLPQVAALLRQARCYVGNDSGISHLAGAVGVRGVVLFGPSDPGMWAPRGGRLQVLHAPAPCLECDADVFCVHRLALETVLTALERSCA